MKLVNAENRQIKMTCNNAPSSSVHDKLYESKINKAKTKKYELTSNIQSGFSGLSTDLKTY